MQTSLIHLCVYYGLHSFYSVYDAALFHWHTSLLMVRVHVLRCACILTLNMAVCDAETVTCGHAADDGVMPQTKEALGHAVAAGCPIVVAITKCDRPDADPEKVKRQLQSEGLELEEAGGSVQVLSHQHSQTSVRVPDLTWDSMWTVS